MGGRFSRRRIDRTSPETMQQGTMVGVSPQQGTTVDVGASASGIDSLAEIFPSWDPAALNDVLRSCHNDQAAAIATIMDWARADDNGRRNSLQGQSYYLPTDVVDANPTVHPRAPYDTFMKAHLLRHESPSVQAITLKAATMLIARAHLAKKIVAMRRAQIACESNVAPPPMLRSFSEEERDMDVLREQMSREEKIEDGQHLLQQRVAHLHLRIIHMEDDGNCQFRAISHELYGHQRWHHKVRQTCVDFLISNTEKYSFFVGSDDEWNSYIVKMSQTKTWGDELTLRAAAEAYNCTIHVTTTEKQNWLLHYYGAEGDSDTVRALFLAYISPIHYNVVCPIDMSLK